MWNASKSIHQMMFSPRKKQPKTPYDAFLSQLLVKINHILHKGDRLIPKLWNYSRQVHGKGREELRPNSDVDRNLSTRGERSCQALRKLNICNDGKAARRFVVLKGHENLHIGQVSGSTMNRSWGPAEHAFLLLPSTDVRKKWAPGSAHDV